MAKDAVRTFGVAGAIASILTVSALMACSKEDFDAQGPRRRTGATGNEDSANPSFLLAPASVRRLSTQEIRSSIRDLFGLDDRAFNWSTFPVEGLSGKRFDNDFESLPSDSAFAEPMQAAAEWAGDAVAKKLNGLLACAATGDDGCAGTFVDTYAPRAYHRPIRVDERARLLGVYTATRAHHDFSTAIATVVEVMLQSPNFLYRTELGDRNAPAAPLTPHELASALSYFLWGSIPDQPLVDAAAAGQLATKADVLTQAQRMLADPRATVAAGRFFEQWLSIGGTLSKEDPAFNAEVNTSMMLELTTFVNETVWGGSRGFKDLLTGSSSFVDGNIATLYGVSPPPGPGMVPTTLDPAKHSGFLTMPGFIATFNGAAYRSPIFLGHFVRGRLLCQHLPPPPDNIPQPLTDPNLDVRRRFEAHSQGPCASCHDRMDPIGYGWSEYDTLGRFSPVDHGVLQDGLGKLVATDVDGPFKGPVELGKKLASSEDVQTCVASTVFSWALGRHTSQTATSSDSQALASAATSGFVDGDFKVLFATLTTADAFRFRDATLVPKGDE